ncbi:MAG: 2-amino-4-hydroxy-6-hydroxymethyldihydropteridine diphosphokinase [Planctomycetes bacterium]|nr:2-amino-4-hydroxy-6-hydroxymethyldihydropteridine diphosphokinase [Planctomycetota bacterium]
MAKALLGLGSNLGTREETLRAAIAAIEALPDVRVARASEFYTSRPLGGPPGQGDFLNAAAAIETKTPPLRLLDELQDIESRQGRKPAKRWAPRTLDIDLLLYDDEVMETPMLTLPHPRMTFRRFVLQPAAEVAPRMLHPVIGWPVERFLLHLDAASDQVAIVSPSENYRGHFAELIAERFGARPIDRPSFATADQLWPSQLTLWLEIDKRSAGGTSVSSKPAGLPYAAAAFPKLTILLDAESNLPNVAKSQWSAVVRRPGRGPTLRLQATEAATFQAEVAAAVEAVWPDLGPANANRLE